MKDTISAALLIGVGFFAGMLTQQVISSRNRIPIIEGDDVPVGFFKGLKEKKMLSKLAELLPKAKAAETKAEAKAETKAEAKAKKE